MVKLNKPILCNNGYTVLSCDYLQVLMTIDEQASFIPFVKVYESFAKSIKEVSNGFYIRPLDDGAISLFFTEEFQLSLDEFRIFCEYIKPVIDLAGQLSNRECEDHIKYAICALLKAYNKFMSSFKYIIELTIKNDQFMVDQVFNSLEDAQFFVNSIFSES